MIGDLQTPQIVSCYYSSMKVEQCRMLIHLAHVSVSLLQIAVLSVGDRELRRRAGGQAGLQDLQSSHAPRQRLQRQVSELIALSLSLSIFSLSLSIFTVSDQLLLFVGLLKTPGCFYFIVCGEITSYCLMQILVRLK